MAEVREPVRTSADASPCKSRKPRSVERWAAAAKAAFTITKVSSPGGGKASTWKDLFVETLKQAALKGDTNARRELNRLSSHLEAQNILDEPPEISAGARAFYDRIAEHKALSEIATPFLLLAHASVDDLLEKEHLARYGTPLVSKYQAPEYLDVEMGRRALAKARKRAEAKTSGGESAEAVGYQKPPQGTRWTKNQSGNPSGRRKSKVDDGWASVRTIMEKSVKVSVNGRSMSLSPDEVICRRLFEMACKGDHAARRDACTLLIELDRRQLLKPPQRRKRRTKASLEWIELRRRYNPIIFRIAELDELTHRLPDVVTVFGPDPDRLKRFRQERNELLVRLGQLSAERKATHGEG